MTRRATAVVVGDVDLVAALGLAGIRPHVVAPPGDPAAFSRFVVHRIGWADPRDEPDRLVELLLGFGARCDEKPVLYYQTDASLLAISRHRHELAQWYRFVLPASRLVEETEDKVRFAELSRVAGLAVPSSWTVLEDGRLPWSELTFPLVVKPVSHSSRARLGTPAKAVRIDTPRELRDRWPTWVASGARPFLQALVRGDEGRIESYHAYVDGEGATVAEFTGAKLRTFPHEYGQSSLVVTSEAPDVLDHGRGVLTRLGVSNSVAKLDFKRDDAGQLWLLEANLRFTLWHHLAAVAGMNIPALVYADLNARPRPAVRAVDAGWTWCHPLRDFRAVKETGGSGLQWARSLAASDARTGFGHRDPLPLVLGLAAPVVARRLPRPHVRTG